MKQDKKKKKGVTRAIALVLVGAAIAQMVSIAFAKPGNKQ